MQVPYNRRKDDSAYWLVAATLHTVQRRIDVAVVELLGLVEELEVQGGGKEEDETRTVVNPVNVTVEPSSSSVFSIFQTPL